MRRASSKVKPALNWMRYVAAGMRSILVLFAECTKRAEAQSRVLLPACGEKVREARMRGGPSPGLRPPSPRKRGEGLTISPSQYGKTIRWNLQAAIFDLRAGFQERGSLCGDALFPITEIE